MERFRRDTQTVDISDLPEHWQTLLERVARGRTRVLLEREGVPVATIISPADAAGFESYETRHERDFAVLERISDAFKDVPLEELEAEAAKAVAKVRQELQRERAARQERMRTEGRRVLEASWRAFADVPPEEIDERVAEAVAEAMAELRREGKV